MANEGELMPKTNGTDAEIPVSEYGSASRCRKRAPGHGAPTFFFREKKSFVTVVTDHHESGIFGIWCAAPTGAQPALMKADPDRFFVPPYVGHRGWLGVRLDRGVDWDELRRIVEDAYGEVAAIGSTRRRRRS